MLRPIGQYSEKTRKMILWISVAVLAFVLLAWLVSGIGERFSNIQI